MREYLYKNGNFNQSYLTTVNSTEGYFDEFNVGAATLALNEDQTGTVAARRLNKPVDGGKADQTFRYEFLLIPKSGFLGSPELLVKDVELQLRFDRAAVACAVVGTKPDMSAVTLNELEIKNCYAIVEYVSSPAIRQRFDSIEMRPFPYDFDQCDVITKSLSQNETTIRIDGFHGGNLPTHLFAGIISKEANEGSLTTSSTNFAANNVEMFNITLNGVSVNGYPIEVTPGDIMYPMFKFNQTVGKLGNIDAGDGFTPNGFECNYLWSHAFDGEITADGWLSIEIRLHEPYTKPMELVVWTVKPRRITIDKFKQIEKILL